MARSRHYDRSDKPLPARDPRRQVERRPLRVALTCPGCGVALGRHPTHAIVRCPACGAWATGDDAGDGFGVLS
jgi:hypothetical protein